MESLSRWRAATLAFFLTIGLTVVFGPVGSLSSVVIGLGFFVLIPLIVLAPELVPLVDDGEEAERQPPVANAGRRATPSRTSGTATPTGRSARRSSNADSTTSSRPKT
jgi:hypothetical protein